MIDPRELIGLTVPQAVRKVGPKIVIALTERDGVFFPYNMSAVPNRFKVSVTNKIIKTCSIG